MRKKNYKGRCEKRVLSKCIGICRTYDALQYAYADLLEENEEVKEFQCNVPLSTEAYTTDFYCEMDKEMLWSGNVYKENYALLV